MRPVSLLTLLALGPIAQGAASTENNSSFPSDAQLGDRFIGSRSTVGDIVAGLEKNIKNATTCAACESILLLLKELADLGDKILIEVATSICKVAKGAVALDGPILTHVLRGMRIGSDTSHLFCSTFLGLCQVPSVPPWSVPFPSPKPQCDERPEPSGQTPIKVVQFSDIHVDLGYTPGASTVCTKSICCRPFTPAEAPGNNSHPAGPHGDHNCDSPPSLEESMYQAINDIVPDAAFVLFTGDIVDHIFWNSTEASSENQINNAYNLMNKHFGLVYGTIGNHESSPINTIQPNSIGNVSHPIYDALSAQWTRWVGTQAGEEIKTTGAYSAKYPHGNLRILTFNSNLYYAQNFWLYEPTMEQDPNNQIRWLVKELDAAEKAGERVYIASHMPMGRSDAFHAGANYIDQVLTRYASTIAGVFYGHTHLDHFEISYTNYTSRNLDQAVLTSYICPALVPTSGMPAMRVYDVDPVTFAVLDTTTYIADMTNPAFQQTGPVWTEYYSAKKAYGSKLNPPVTDPKVELTAAFWHNVTELFKSDPTTFNEYFSRKTRGWKNTTCTGACLTQEICQLGAARSQDNCEVIKPTLSIRKRSRDEEEVECGVSVVSKMLNVLPSREMLQELHSRFVEVGGKLGRCTELDEMEI